MIDDVLRFASRVMRAIEHVTTIVRNALALWTVYFSVRKTERKGLDGCL